MPLFGRSALRLADGQELGSALVLPSREKLLTRAPYPRLSQVFLNATDQCDLGLFIGTSLRDHHIRGAAQSVPRRVPLFIINPEGDTYGIEGAQGLAQCASTFLISTLPNALAKLDPVAALDSTKGEAKSGGVLAALRQALETSATISSRCEALDELDNRGTGLDSKLLRQLLADSDATVARYALGLVLLSPDRNALMETAERSSHTGDAPFFEDLKLLRSLISADEGH